MKKLIKKLPNLPGVYFFKRGKKTLYIGKATSLRDRVKSYFSRDIAEARGPKIVKMLQLATSVGFEKTNSVLEALLLEASLIKKYQPVYNTDEKDDKSFNFVVITKEKHPRVLVVRGKELPAWSGEIKYQFGPFPHGGELREAMKIIRRIFPYRDTCLPCETGRGLTRTAGGLAQTKNCRPCFNRQIGLCPGVCTGEITTVEYAKIINNIRLFFEGKKSKVVLVLKREMKTTARAREFEKAATIRNQLFALDHINDVALLRREIKAAKLSIEAFDVAHLAGTSAVGVMTAVSDGALDKNKYRKFRLRLPHGGDDLAALIEVLRRRFSHREWAFPDLVVVDGGVTQKNTAEKVLHEFKVDIPVAAVVKDEHHKARHILGEQRIVHDYHREILLANAESHRFAIRYHRRLRDRVR